MSICNNRLKKLLGGAEKQALEHFDFYRVTLGETDLLIYISRKSANKASHIYALESGDIIWEQLYPFGGMSRPSSDRQYVLKPQRKRDSITVVAIRGTAASITGLDTDAFKSHLASPLKNNIYLMSEAHLESFIEKLG
ncbi:MAG: hypothetical protein IJY24_03545 [Clostridia bacterium]|nr:hypothetical protein [Clostridia bacterium]